MNQHQQNHVNAVNNVGHGGGSATALDGRGEEGPPSPKWNESSLYMDTAHLLVSLIHGWNMDASVDGLCSKVLRLPRPKIPLCYGVMSRRGHVSLRMPYCSGKSPALSDHSYQHFSQSIRWLESR